MIKNLPKPGKRNIKTAIAIFICLIIYELTGRKTSITGITSAMICLADSPEGSLRSGINRILGTIIGAIFAIIIAYLFGNIEGIPWYIISCIGLIIFIHALNLMEMNDSITIGGVVFLVILLDYTVNDPISYAIGRAFDTSIGIVVAVFVNYFFFKGSYDRETSKKSGIDNFKFKIKRNENHKVRKWQGGKSTELFIFPKKTSFLDRNFKWRVSTSTTDFNETKFVKLLGYERHIISLSGSVKYVQSGNDIKLNKLDQTVLDGKTEIKCFGLSTDYKLIISKRDYDGEVKKIYYNKINKLISKDDSIKKTISKTYYSLYDDLKMTVSLYKDESFDVILNKGDLFVLENIDSYLKDNKDYEPILTFYHEDKNEEDVLCIESSVAKK